MFKSGFQGLPWTQPRIYFWRGLRDSTHFLCHFLPPNSESRGSVCSIKFGEKIGLSWCIDFFRFQIFGFLRNYKPLNIQISATFRTSEFL